MVPISIPSPLQPTRRRLLCEGNVSGIQLPLTQTTGCVGCVARGGFLPLCPFVRLMAVLEGEGALFTSAIRRMASWPSTYNCLLYNDSSMSVCIGCAAIFPKNARVMDYSHPCGRKFTTASGQKQNQSLINGN